MRIKLLISLAIVLIISASAVSAQVQPGGCPLPTLASGDTSLLSPTSTSGITIANGENVEFYISKCSTQETAYTFKGQEGDVFTIWLKSSINYNGNPCLSLISKTGGVLGQGAPANYGDQRSTTVIWYALLPTSGEYKIVVQPCNNNGHFTLQLIKTVIKPIPFNTVVNDKFDAIERSLAFSFDGQANDEIYIKVDPQFFQLSVELFCLPRAACGNENGNLPSQLMPTAALYNAPVRLPLTGKYMITLRAPIQLTEIGLSVNLLKPTPIRYGDTLDTDLGPNMPIKVYSFFGRLGDIVQMHVESDNQFDTSLSVIKDFAVIRADDDSGTDLNPEIIDLPLDKEGTYTVIIQPLRLGDHSRIKFNISSTNIDLDKQSRVVTLGSKQTFTVMSFNGKAGEHIEVSVRNVTKYSGKAQTTIAQNGITIVEAGQTGGDGSRIEFTVPQDGRVSVKIMVNDSIWSTFEVSLKHLDE